MRWRIRQTHRNTSQSTVKHCNTSCDTHLHKHTHAYIHIYEYMLYILYTLAHTHTLMDDDNVQHTTTQYNILTHHNTQGACLTITTRQNLQLYGIRLENVPEHWEALRGAGIFSLQAGILYIYIYISHTDTSLCVRVCYMMYLMNHE